MTTPAHALSAVNTPREEGRPGEVVARLHKAPRRGELGHEGEGVDEFDLTTRRHSREGAEPPATFVTLGPGHGDGRA
jgi:hypothetical protein